MADTTSELSALEHAVEAAVTRKDAAFLDTVYSADFVFQHGTRRVDDKASWLDSLRGGGPAAASRTLSELAVEPHGDVATTTALISVVAATGRVYSIRYVRVYAQRDGRWQMLSHRTLLQVPVPPPPAVDFALAAAIAPTPPERYATGFEFTEGPLWHLEGWWSCVDYRSDPYAIWRVAADGAHQVLLRPSGQANGCTFDANGNLVFCQAGERRLARLLPDGRVEAVADRFEGKRLNLPNDVICASDGSLYFTDPGLRLPLSERDLPGAVYRVAPGGAVTMVAEVEYPNGLAFSPDERTLYVANTRHTMCVLALRMGADGTVASRGIFADMSSDDPNGVPDGMKVDVEGRGYVTGPGSGIWVFAPDGYKLGLITLPEAPANLAFGGPDSRTVLATARTSVYSFRVGVPGLPGHPWRG